MPQSAQEIVQLRRMHEYEPLLRGVRGTYLFDIEQVGCWFVAVDDGKIKITEGRHEADCAISCSEEDFIEIFEGRRNLVTAALQGRVQVRGDVTLAQKFHGLVGTRIERSRGGA
jgi:ubiquinone biosynthesis protein UbiJ